MKKIEINKIYEPIAIIGSSCRLPGGANSLDEYWHNLSTSYDGIIDIPSQRCLQESIYASTPQVGKSYAKKAGLINNIDAFDAKFFGITDEEATAMDPQHRLLLEAAWHALEDSSQLKNSTLLGQTGLFVGIATDDYTHIGMHSHDLNKINTYTTLGSLRSISAGRVAYHLGLNGPVNQIDTACSSSLMAIHQACQSLRLNEADCMLAGGINLLISPHTMISLSQIKALSLTNCCRVFDNSADGYVRGEGYGLVVLKRLSDAKVNNDNIIAVIKGSLSNHDGASNGLTAPNGLAQEKLLQKTLKISNVDSQEISYIETHGTGTLFGDPIEVNTIINVYGKNRFEDNPLFLGSVKSSIGHLEAAAGVAGLLKVCSSITNKQLAPNLNFSTPNPYIKWNKAPIKVVDTLQAWSNDTNRLRTAAISSFGFSGTNVHMIIQEYEDEYQDLVVNELEDKLYLIPISAKSSTSLKNLVNKWLNAYYLADKTIDTISFSAITTRKHFKYKLLVLARDYKDLIAKLKSWNENQETELLWSSIDFTPLSNKYNINKNYIDAINNYFMNDSINWKELYGNNKIPHCKLPIYTFDRKSYWWDALYDFIKKASNKQIQNENISYKLKWEEYFLDESQSINDNIHIIADTKEDSIIKLLEDFSDDLTYIFIKTKDFLNKPINENTNYIYIIDIDNDTDMFENSISKVWSITHYFLQNNKSSKIWIVTKHINNSSIWGLFRSLKLELEDSLGGMIDMPQNINRNTINKMFMCISRQDGEDQYLLHNEKVYVPRLLPQKLEVVKPFSFDKKASYKTKEQFSQYFIDIVSQTLEVNKNEISTTQNLFSIGLNSMLSMYIRQALEGDLNLKTEPTLFFKKQTIELLVEYLWEQYQSNNMLNEQIDEINGKTIFLFSGQGTQYPGMGKSLYNSDEEFKQSVDYCINFLQKEFNLDFKSILFDEQSNLLNQTKYAQLALFIIEYSLYKKWQKENFFVDYFIGHSIGEYVAACLAGVFSLEDALRLLKARGQLMQSLEGHGDMLVAFDSLENIPALPDCLDIAATNSPWQTVISGDINHLKNYEQQLSKRKIKAQLLNTKQAFHSKIMASILEEFHSVASKVIYQEPKIPIITNVNAKEDISYMMSAKYWSDHIISTVQFASSIQRAYEKGCRFFIEVGPGSVLKNLAEQNTMQKDSKCYYFNSLINEDNSKEYLNQQIGNLKSYKKSLLSPKDELIKEDFFKPITHNAKDIFKPFVLTPMQHAYWIGRNKEVADGGVAIHMYLELDIKQFNKERFTNAWTTLIRRHDMLHAMVDRNGEQRILEHIPKFTIMEYCLKQSNQKQKERYLQDVRQEMSHQNVSLEKWPQFELRISHLNDNSSRVHISIDGWSIDGWSYQILFHELHQLYLNPEVKLPSINISFRDYVLQLKKIEDSAFYQKHLDKWIERLKVLPKAPQLPMKKDETNNTNRFKRWEHFISKEQYISLKQNANDNALTIVTTLLSAYAWVLSRYSKEHNITLNIPRFNRLALHADINRVIGEFASFTLLACTRDKDTTFKEYANRIQKQLWEDVENPWVSGVTLLRELAKITKQSNVVMPYVFTNMPEQSLDGKKLEFLNEWGKSAEIPYFLTQTPQVQIDCQYHDKDHGLFISWDVLIDRFDSNMIDDLFYSYIHLLQNLSSSSKMWEENSLHIQKSSSLIAKEMEISKQSIYEQFTNVVQKYGKNIAIYSENKTITYEQLYEKSQQLGRYLINNINFDDETPVIAIVMDKGWQQVIAVMGALASGAIFLPLDSNLPKDRMQYALQNANAKMVLSKDSQISLINEKLKNIDIPLISVDDKSIYKTDNKILPINYEDTICIIYTSGSTGLPKGVMLTQKGLINSIEYTNHRFGIDLHDTILSLTPMHHDMALFDIFGAFVCGACIVVPEDKKRKDPHHWLSLIKQHKVSVWNSVPAMMEMLLKFSDTNQTNTKQQLASLRLCFLGGDWIPLSIPVQLKKFNTKTRLISVGGPTETTLWNIMYELKEFDSKWRSIPYGKPIANTKYFILNTLLEECPTYITGELYVSGIGLAKGYVNDLEKTQEVFIYHPKTKERMYKTGDLGRLLPNGEIEFMGRSDNQVQISGYRIELSELESLALKQKEIEKVQVFLIKDVKTPYIALVYSCNGSDISEYRLKEKLKEALPTEMIPKKILKIEQFPLTANGKIDRNALKQLVINKKNNQQDSQIVLENEIHKSLMQLWQKYLQRESIGLYENFFEAGGNSLLATELFIEIREKFPIVDSVVLLYEHTSIYELSRFIEKQTKSNKEVNINKRGLQRRKKLLAKY